MELPPVEHHCPSGCYKNALRDPDLSTTAKLLWFYIQAQWNKDFVRSLYQDADQWDELYPAIKELREGGYFIDDFAS